MKKLIISVMFLSLVIPFGAHASFYQSKEQDFVDRKIASTTLYLQGQIDSLSYQLLQLKTAGIPAQQQAQVQTVIQQVVVDEDTKAEVETLKRKVGILESAVNVLQTSVMNALNTTIGLLKQLLKL